MAGETPSLAELDQLELLDGVIREALRLLPPAPWTTRIAAEDAEIGGYSIPRGTEVVLSIFHTHRVEPIYEEPNKFNPGRWKHIKPDVFEFNAFGAGVRSCIGSGFALLQMKLILAMVIKRFRLELAPNQFVNPILNITMAPSRGLRMIVRDDINFSVNANQVSGRICNLMDFATDSHSDDRSELSGACE